MLVQKGGCEEKMYSLGVFCVLICTVFSDELVSVVVIYRHGDRTPVDPYPNDPYRNQSYWPVDFGQLTNIGKMQHYRLGKWLRQRYEDFLPNKYNEKDFLIRSTDVDRTLMSAEANLAGLYPPIKDQIWNPSILWQPIPIHTIPEAEDNLVAMKKSCPIYDNLLANLFQSDFFRKITKKNQQLYQYVTENSGTDIHTLADLEYLYNTLYIEELYNFTLPTWTKKVFPNSLKPLAELSFATMTFTRDLAKFKTGPLFNEIIQNFEKVTVNATKSFKFMVFSGHDTTIANVLNTMGAFSYHCPPYASTIIFELRKDTLGYYINIFYKNSSNVQDIILEGCKFNCRFKDFTTILQPILLTRDEWDSACSNRFIFTVNQMVVFLSPFVVTGFVFLVVLIYFVVKACLVFKRKNFYVKDYIAVPNDDTP